LNIKSFVWGNIVCLIFLFAQKKPRNRDLIIWLTRLFIRLGL